MKMKKFLFVFILFIGFTIIPQVSKGEGNYFNQAIHWLESSFNISNGQVVVEPLNDNFNFIAFESNDFKNSYMIGYRDLESQELQIIEYGYGIIVPYQSNVIPLEEQPALSRLKYFSPFESYWEGTYEEEKILFDGSTGEWLPEIKDFTFTKKDFGYLQVEDKVGEKLIKDKLKFDPYEDSSWLVENNRSKLTEEEVISNINKDNQVIFIGHKYNNQVTFAYPVIGYQESESSLFLAIYDECLNLTRFVSSKEFNNYGDFYLY